MQTAKDRLLLFLNELGVGQKKFESRCGLSNGYVNKLRASPSIEVMRKIVGAYPQLNTEWFMTGEGSMLRDTKTAVPAAKTASGEEGIPLIPIEAMAGALTGERTVLEYECERYIIPAFKGADFLIPVKGISMQPTYNAGDIVACRRVPLSDIFFQWGKTYVIDTNQGALLKRIKPATNSENVLIVSDNKDYDPFELPREAIHAVALVVGLIRIE